MIRRAAAVVFALAINPALIHAQDVIFTVTVPSADVHTGPTTVTPVVGHVSRGTMLPVSRNLGSWIKVSWPAAPEGVGYLHVTMGRLAQPNADAPARVSARAAGSVPAANAVDAGTGTAPAAAAAPLTSAEPITTRPRDGIAVHAQQSIHPIGHLFGIGGLIGSTGGFGAAARAWRPNRLGIQLGVTHDAATSEAVPGRVTSLNFEPSILYALLDHVTDDVWMRPYVGSGVIFGHQTLTGVPGSATSSANATGFRVFAGTELILAAVPQLGLSADVGYRRLPATVAGFGGDGIAVAIAAHWYVK